MSDSYEPRIEINYLIRISERDLGKFLEVFKMGKIKADDYCPTPEECEELSKDLPKYLPFLLWVDETGFNTSENEENRKYLRHYLYNKMIIK